MAAWIAPALVAAVIAVFVSVVGWFVTAGLSFRAEQRRRDDRTRDFMIALRAEIGSEPAGFAGFDGDLDLEEVCRRLSQDGSQDILVPKPVRHIVVDALIPELFILPEDVIDPVIVYLRQREAVPNLTEDIRSSTPTALSRTQTIALYRIWSSCVSGSLRRQQTLSVLWRRLMRFDLESVMRPGSRPPFDRLHRRQRAAFRWLHQPIEQAVQKTVHQRHRRLHQALNMAMPNRNGK